MFIRLAYIWVVIGLFVMLGCQKRTDPTVRTTPDTQIFLDTIRLDGENRLSTNVEMHWLGASPNGYIKGYELSIDNSDWIFTTATDTIFRFTITDTSGGQTIVFKVRAIDDSGIKDPSPAVLKIPIKNTIPEVALDQGLTDTIYSVFSLRWTASDLDGNETLDSVFFKINNGKWYGLSASTSLITIVPITPGVSGEALSQVYTDASAKLQTVNIQGLLVDGKNKVYIKVKDNSRAFSKMDSSISFHLNRKRGDLLVVGSHIGGPALRVCSVPTPTCQSDSRTPAQVLLSALDGAYGAGNYDYINIVANNKKFAPKLWDPTFLLFMKLYDKIFWFSDLSPDKTDCRMPLELASATIQKYLNSGGKILISTSIPLTNYSSPCADPSYKFNLSSSLFQYTPMDSMYLFTGAVLRKDSALVPTSNAVGYPKLTVLPSSGNIYTSLSPFKAKTGAEVMYTANIQRTGSWIGVTGYNNFIARVRVNGKTNMVFSSIELNRLMGASSDLSLFLKKVLTEEFNW